MVTAKEEGTFISFDPNFRKDLWKEQIPTFIELTSKGIALADFVKVSDEELAIITGYSDLSKGTKALHQLGG
jgi:fructokinase